MVTSKKVVAFIPARGGSKSILHKNIKLFCGKPLVCWVIEALEKCGKIDVIVVATDSVEVEQTVVCRNYKKTIIYHRSAENSNDTASSDSVILEYLNYAHLSSDTILMLVQATSPLTETIHFKEALDIYEGKKYDSILTCVRNKRFFWNEDGTSMNYDYKNRPRRQDFHGILMENGAFYINSVGNILLSGNRLSGKIGIYEMPSYTATEIDEPDDWIILEGLMKKYVLSKKSKVRRDIKLFLCDIDGTLTDGGMYYSENGDELKKFNTRDGMGFQLLRNAGIKTGLITSEDRVLNLRRALKLHIDFLRQGEKDTRKLTVANEICNEMGISLEEVAYIGDDENCFDLLMNVGLAACPYDACEKVKSIPNIHIMKKKGGDSCVREFIDYIINCQLVENTTIIHG